MPTTEIFMTSQARGDVLDRIRRLLERAFAGGFSVDDWEHTLGGWHVVATESGSVRAHAAVVARTLHIGGDPFRTGYVEGVATLPGRQRQGLGFLVMSRAMGLVRAESELGALSTSRHGFYERLGWERWRGPTFVRRGAESMRTHDEDDGVMVLRFGRSAQVDLTASITCEARSGDDW